MPILLFVSMWGEFLSKTDSRGPNIILPVRPQKPPHMNMIDEQVASIKPSLSNQPSPLIQLKPTGAMTPEMTKLMMTKVSVRTRSCN